MSRQDEIFLDEARKLIRMAEGALEEADQYLRDVPQTADVIVARECIAEAAGPAGGAGVALA